MIISHGRAFIFVHIPKTGGTAMSLALEARAKKDDILVGDTPKAQRRKHRLEALEPSGRLWKHSTLADIDGVVTSQELDQMFIFTLVRNPWDRLVSYYHWLQDQRFDHPAVALSRSLEFDAFVRDPQMVRSISASPASHYVTDAEGRERCDAFVRLEFLKKDIKPVEKHLGFSLNIPRANASRRPEGYRSFYDAELQEFVAHLCAEDIERFGYSF